MIASAPLALGRGKARVDLLSVDRGNANSVVVRWRVVNEGKEPITEGSESFSPQFVTPESDVRGVTLVDLVSNRRYYPRVTPEQSCLCTKTASFDIAAKPVERDVRGLSRAAAGGEDDRGGDAAGSRPSPAFASGTGRSPRPGSTPAGFGSRLRRSTR